jgi:hypothetical protein
VLPKHCNKIARVIGIRKPKYTEDYDTIILTAVKSWFDFALEAERKKTPAVKMSIYQGWHIPFRKCAGLGTDDSGNRHVSFLHRTPLFSSSHYYPLL